MARHRLLSNSSTGRSVAALRRLRPATVALALLPQPALPPMPGAGARGLAPGALARTAGRAVLPPGVHAAASAQCTGGGAAALGLRDAVAMHGRHPQRVRRQSALAGRLWCLH